MELCSLHHSVKKKHSYVIAGNNLTGEILNLFFNIMSLVFLGLLEIYIIINFRACKISRVTRKLTKLIRTLILIIKKTL
jgi:hypothetical protein